MRHREIIPRMQGGIPAELVFGESDEDANGVPKSWKIRPSIPEKPADEMARLIRAIAGRRVAGEKDEQLRARAARRLGISISRAKVLWYAETNNIRADEMDRARELAFVQPIEEAISAVTAAEQYLAGLRERLLDRVVGSSGDHRGNAADVRAARSSPSAGNGSVGGHSRPPVLDGHSVMTLRRFSAE